MYELNDTCSNNKTWPNDIRLGTNGRSQIYIQVKDEEDKQQEEGEKGIDMGYLLTLEMVNIPVY